MEVMAVKKVSNEVHMWIDEYLGDSPRRPSMQCTILKRSVVEKFTYLVIVTRFMRYESYEVLPIFSGDPRRKGQGQFIAIVHRTDGTCSLQSVHACSIL